MISKLLEKTGTKNHMTVASFANRLKYGKHERYRQKMYQQHFSNHSPATVMKDSWATDSTKQLPYLKTLLNEAGQIIAEQRTPKSNKGFMADILTPQDIRNYPSLINFITSPEIIATAAQYLGHIPILSSVKLLHSTPDATNLPTSSQMFHLDIDLRPQVKVFVNLINITTNNGPFSFLPASLSEKITKTINYRSAGSEVRIPDHTVLESVATSNIHHATGKAGTVLFIDTGHCLHYGSRDIKEDRFVLHYQLAPAVRTDFRHPPTYKNVLNRQDLWLKRAVLDQEYLG